MEQPWAHHSLQLSQTSTWRRSRSTALATALAAPHLWTRFVDDIFVIWTFVIWTHSQDKREAFHQHLNNHHPQIKFTMEREEDNRISFLDVAMTRKDRSFTNEVYRKPTHTTPPTSTPLWRQEQYDAWAWEQRQFMIEKVERKSWNT